MFLLYFIWRNKPMQYMFNYGTDDYYTNLDLQYMRGEIPLHIYQMQNNKPAWYNLELKREEMKKRYLERQRQEAEKVQAKREEAEEKKKYLEKPQIYEKSQRLLKTTKSFLERMKEEEKEQKERKRWWKPEVSIC